MDIKQFKQTSPTLLEYLPNELFVAIFSYLNGVDAVFAFSNLNNHFQRLLFEYCQIFDFKSIKKEKFDFVLQQHNIQQLKSLQLSNDDDTPEQIEYFCERYSLTDLCPQLKSLSLLKLKIEHNSNTLFDQLSSLKNLHSLTIESICTRTMLKFSFPKLKRLVLSSCKNTIWIENFPKLESVEYMITNCCFYQPVLIWPSTLKQLKIVYVKDEDLLLVQKSLVHLFQLITLEIYQNEKGQSYPDGQVWEQLISSSLPLIKNFRFYFQFKYVRNSFNSVNQIVASFSTPFYLFKKNWFVHHDVYETSKSWGAIYTASLASDRFRIFSNSFNKSISTYFNDNNNISNKNVYENVKTLVLEEKLLKPNESLNKIKVVNLVLNSHLNSINWIHVLTKLRHLEIKSGTEISLEHFLHLLDNTPYLYSLIAEMNILRALTEYWRNICVCSRLSKKICSLKLHSTLNRSEYLSEDELQQIVRIFPLKCQHLSLSVQSPNNTIGLILRSMSQLHSLHVNITGINYPSINMIWLQTQQTKFNNSNCRIVNDGHDHYFWLG